MRRIVTIASVAICLVVAATACEVKDATPVGTGPLRYRDTIFPVVDKTFDITYGNAPAFDGSGPVDLKLDLYQPHGDTVTGRPLVVYVHGGSFSSGDKQSAELLDEANVLVKKGFVVASIDYRLDEVGCNVVAAACITAIQGATHDAQAAVRFLRKRHATYRIDPARIAMAGTSAGAIAAVNVAYAGKDVGSSGSPGTSSAIRAAVSLSGAAITQSPHAGDAPVLFFHGTDDHVVPYVWMTNTRSDAAKVGAETELTSWEGDGHVPYREHRQQILDETRNFLYAHLDLAHAAR